MGFEPTYAENVSQKWDSVEPTYVDFAIEPLTLLRDCSDFGFSTLQMPP